MFYLTLCSISLCLIPLIYGFITVRMSSGKEVNITTTDDLIQVLTRKDCEKLHCKGADCRLVTEYNGCQICICPLGSPGRGCDKMPESMWNDLFNAGCPDDKNDTIVRSKAQGVLRWYRMIDKPMGIDECRSYIFPYCDSLDYNLWRSPRSPAECLQYCYSRKDRRRHGIVYSYND